MASAWSRVDLTRGVFRLGAGHTKTRKGREVPMTVDVYKVVSDLPRRAPRLFSLRQAVSGLDGFGISATSAQSPIQPAEIKVTTRQN